jgi:hypothetical protein
MTLSVKLRIDRMPGFKIFKKVAITIVGIGSGSDSQPWAACASTAVMRQEF